MNGSEIAALIIILSLTIIIFTGFIFFIIKDWKNQNQLSKPKNESKKNED